jgi:N-acetylneuraminic acid mutarotase
MKHDDGFRPLDLKSNHDIQRMGLADNNNNWYELRFPNLGPERRGYHSTFVHNKRLFIFGGHDIREGSMDNLWMLDLRKMRDMELEPIQQQKDCVWKQIPTKAISPEDRPGQVAHHTSIVFGDKMFLFGGSNLETENKKFFSLDLNQFKWEIVKVRGDGVPDSRDEHSACFYENEASMIIFGGFIKGVRTNEMDKFLFQENRWVKLTLPQTAIRPRPRSGHSAVIHQSSMYVFGGRGDDNIKLNDLWRFDISTNVWQEIKQEGTVPIPRCGHSCDIFEGQYLIMFGGIYEITKELNDLQMFDLTKKKWVTLFDESNSPARRDGSPTFNETNAENGF